MADRSVVVRGGGPTLAHALAHLAREMHSRAGDPREDPAKAGDHEIALRTAFVPAGMGGPLGFKSTRDLWVVEARWLAA